MSTPQLFPTPPAAAPRTATISPCGTWRYQLTRRWSPGPLTTWIMLNPSTADAERDDPTIRRVTTFTRHLTPNAAGFLVVNLYAHRATNPDDLLTATDPVGPDNHNTLHHAIFDGHAVIAAWGAWPGRPHRPAHPDINRIANEHGRRLHCLGLTAGGQPRHPLYVHGTTPLTPYDPTRKAPA